MTKVAVQRTFELIMTTQKPQRRQCTLFEVAPITRGNDKMLMHLPEPNATAFRRRGRLALPERLKENRTWDILDVPLGATIQDQVTETETETETAKPATGQSKAKFKGRDVVAKKMIAKPRVQEDDNAPDGNSRNEKEKKEININKQGIPRRRPAEPQVDVNDNNPKIVESAVPPVKVVIGGQKNTVAFAEEPTATRDFVAREGKVQNRVVVDTNPNESLGTVPKEEREEGIRRARRSSVRRGGLKPRQLELLPSLSFTAKKIVSGLGKPGMLGNDITQAEIERALGVVGGRKKDSILSVIPESPDGLESEGMGLEEDGNTSEAEIEEILLAPSSSQTSTASQDIEVSLEDPRKSVSVFLLTERSVQTTKDDLERIGLQTKILPHKRKVGNSPKASKMMLVVAREGSVVNDFVEDFEAGKVAFKGKSRVE